MSGWNDERVAALRRYWADGFSASQVAAKLGGITRNSVISKVHRLGLSGRVTTSRHKAGRKCTRKPMPMPVASPSRVDKVRALVADGLPIPPPAEFDVPRIATVDLKEHDCRFPCVADVKTVSPYAPIFCGLKVVHGLVYCEVHARRAFAPPKPRPPAVPILAPVVENEMEAA